MILSRDVLDTRGLLLVAENTTLRPAHIERLRYFNDVEPLPEIYVYQAAETSPRT